MNGVNKVILVGSLKLIANSDESLLSLLRTELFRRNDLPF